MVWKYAPMFQKQQKNGLETEIWTKKKLLSSKNSEIWS